jgi:hypothetical protein
MHCDSRLFWEDRSGFEQTPSAFLLRNLREAQCSTSTVGADDLPGSWALRSKLDIAPPSGSRGYILPFPPLGGTVGFARPASNDALIGAFAFRSHIRSARCTWMKTAMRAIPIQWGSAQMCLVRIEYSCSPRNPQNLALNKSQFCPGVNHVKPPAS